MRALSSGQDGPRAVGGTSNRESLAQIGQDHRFATDDFEPGSPDATAWPVAPEHGGQRWRMGPGFRWMGDRWGRGIEWPEHGAHPSWLERGAAFLTLCTQGAGATMADARSVQHSERAIALGTPLLEIERMVGRTAQGAIRLRSKCGAWKSMRKRDPCPLERTVDDRRWRRFRWFRASVERASASSAGANSVVQSGVPESCCPSSSRIFHAH